jgi:hypothetical protein
MTASNGRTRRTRHKPNARWDAYDNLPPLTRQALQEGPQQWCDIMIKKHIKDMSALLKIENIDAFMANQIHRWHRENIEEAHEWQPMRKPRHPVPSPHILANATMQMSGRT